jgi:hypothetical protein
MVNENHFRFDRKTFFNFWKIKTVNNFSKLNSPSLHTCLISDCRNSAMVGCRNPAALESGYIWPLENLSTPESGDIRLPLPDAGGPDSG